MSEDQPTAEEIMEDKKVDEFRELIRKIKKTVIERNVYRSQDPAILNEIQEFFASQLYSLLLPIVRGEAEVSSLKNQEFQSIFTEILNPPCSEFLRRRLEYYLHRDFVMFPFTYDPQSINSQENSDSLATGTKIVSRN